MENKNSIWFKILDISDLTIHPIVWVGIIIIGIILIACGFVYVFIAALVIWYLWRGNHFGFSIKVKIIGTLVVILFVFIFSAIISYENRAPTLIIQSPINNSSIEASTTTVTGKVSPGYSSVMIEGFQVSVSQEGNFTDSVELQTATTTITIETANGGNSTDTVLTIFRIYSPEEIAQMQAEATAAQQVQEQATAAADKAQAAQQAAAIAKQNAYDNSPAGKICIAHPGWSPDVCASIAQGQLTIGMTEDQARLVRGTPDAVNTNTDINGTITQWVYEHSNYLNSYIYFDNGILNSYQN
jgi:hypothetical protein